MSSYFATDGNYGSADDLVVVDTTDWGFAEWTLIEQSGDSYRPIIAAEIAARYKKYQLSEGEK